MKIIYIIGSVCIVSLIVFIGVYGASAFASALKLVPPLFIQGSIVTEKGRVIENVITSSAGQPMYLKVKKEGGMLSGSEIKVIYHANDTPCIKDGMHIKAGQKIEFHGIAVAGDTISLCGSKDYYVNLLEQPNAAKPQ